MTVTFVVVIFLFYPLLCILQYLLYNFLRDDFFVNRGVRFVHGDFRIYGAQSITLNENEPTELVVEKVLEIVESLKEFKLFPLGIDVKDICFRLYFVYLFSTVPIQREFEERTSTSSNRFSSPVSC